LLLLAWIALSSGKTPIAEWLVEVNPSLSRYSDAFERHGFVDSLTVMESSEQDLHEAFEKLQLRKPHRRLILKRFKAASGVVTGNGSTGRAESEAFETKYARRASGVTDRDGEAWFKTYSKDHPAQMKFINTVESQKFKKLLRLCRDGVIEQDGEKALLYGQVPLLNWLGQHMDYGGQKQHLDDLLQCLVEEAGLPTEIDVVNDPTDKLPAIVEAYRGLPLLLQATEMGRVDIIAMLVQNGADLTAAYQLPRTVTASLDGTGSTTQVSSTGVTALHAIMMLSDPSSKIQNLFNKQGRRQIRDGGKESIEMLRRIADSIRSGGVGDIPEELAEDVEGAADKVEEALAGLKEEAKRAKGRSKKGGMMAWSGAQMHALENADALSVLIALFESSQVPNCWHVSDYRVPRCGVWCVVLRFLAAIVKCICTCTLLHVHVCCSVLF
jgi:hypothetical protein